VPLGPEGLTGSKNLSQVRPTQLLRAGAITYENGTLQKEGGTTKYNTVAITGAPTVQGGWDWWPSEGVQRMVVVTSAGKILKDDGSGTFATTLKTALIVASVVPVFVEGGKEAVLNNRKLFVFTGKNAVQVLSGDGVVTANLSTPPADWATVQPTTGVVHEGRVWGFAGHFGYYSTTTDHENFTGATSGSMPVYPGEGEKIICSFVFGPYIIVGKSPRGWYLIDTTDPTVTNWKVKRLTREIGAASPLAYAVGEGDAVVIDVSGEMFALSSVSQLQDIRPRSLTQDAEFSPFIRDNTNAAQYGKLAMLYYAAKRQAWEAIAGAGAAVNSARIKMDFNRPSTLRFAFSSFVTCESLWLRKDVNGIPRPVGGDDAGFVRLLDRDGRSHDSAGFTGEFQTAYTDFTYVEPSLGTKRKNFQFLELHFEPKGAWDLSVDVLIDGKTVQSGLAFNMGSGGSQLGATGSTTGTVLGSWTLAGDSTASKRRRIVGSGRRLSIVGRNSGDGQDFSIAKALVGFTPADER
jgi:hypothetical protein